MSKKPCRALTLQQLNVMPLVRIHDIIDSEKAKTIDHALAVVQHIRSTSASNDTIILDFSNITWITSMFADRLVKALATFYGRDFEKFISVTNIEETNVMFKPLWKSALEKFRYTNGKLAQA
jgi:hypothetical protein